MLVLIERAPNQEAREWLREEITEFITDPDLRLDLFPEPMQELITLIQRIEDLINDGEGAMRNESD